jgi:hypothetical protein
VSAQATLDLAPIPLLAAYHCEWDRITYYGVQYPRGRAKPNPALELAETLAMYAEARGRPARCCICSVADAAAVSGTEGVQVAGRNYMPAGRWYVGSAEDAA